jgi:PAS domain S-box-containing protein
MSQFPASPVRNFDVAEPSATSAIYGSGEMADLIRNFDWSTTPVGPIEQWPDTLLITVNTMLATRHPMFLWWGPELIQFYNDGYRPSIRSDKHPKAVGQRGRECWPEIWHIIGFQIEAVMTRGESTWHEDALVPIYRDGKLEDVYWTYSYSPVRDANGVIHGTLVTCSETTPRVQAEKALRTERERLLSLFRQAPAFVAVLRGPDHVFAMHNPQYQELIGQRNVIGKTVAEAIPEAGTQGFVPILDRVYQSGEPFVAYSYPVDLQRSPGAPLERRYLDFVYQALREADESISGIIVLGVDITERKRAEDTLRSTEKLTAVGRLASSIAHEINNPLEAVVNLLYLIEQPQTDVPVMKEYARQASQELARVSQITTQTLRFFRQSTVRSRVRVSDLLESVLTLYQGRLLNSKIRAERRFRDPALLCYEGEIRQVLNNLIGNAVDVLREDHGGRLLVRARAATQWSTGARGVQVTVADTGHGMDRQTQSRIFEAFFSTKGIGGTGLGLWVSAEIINKHQGTLRVRSRPVGPHRGTVFSFFIPEQQ